MMRTAYGFFHYSYPKKRKINPYEHTAYGVRENFSFRKKFENGYEESLDSSYPLRIQNTEYRRKEVKFSNIENRHHRSLHVSCSILNTYSTLARVVVASLFTVQPQRLLRNTTTGNSYLQCHPLSQFSSSSVAISSAPRRHS